MRLQPLFGLVYMRRERVGQSPKRRAVVGMAQVGEFVQADVVGESAVGVDAEADGPDQLLALVDSTPCDILVTDFAMPGNQQADGYSLLGLMRRRHPDLPSARRGASPIPSPGQGRTRRPRDGSDHD